jgi:hypothetical protein
VLRCHASTRLVATGTVLELERYAYGFGAVGAIGVAAMGAVALELSAFEQLVP